jgi:hypothetical protein
MICFSSAFVPPFQVLGHRLEIRSQFGKGLLYVNVAGRGCELQTFFGLLKTFLRRQHDGTKLRPVNEGLRQTFLCARRRTRSCTCRCAFSIPPRLGANALILILSEHGGFPNSSTSTISLVTVATRGHDQALDNPDGKGPS